MDIKILKYQNIRKRGEKILKKNILKIYTNIMQTLVNSNV